MKRSNPAPGLWTAQVLCDLPEAVQLKKYWHLPQRKGNSHANCGANKMNRNRTGRAMQRPVPTDAKATTTHCFESGLGLIVEA